MKQNDKPHTHVAAALIWSDGRLLITKRPVGNHLAGYWELPGGKKEQNETLEQCLEREIMEELGLVVTVVRCIMTIRHEYESKKITLHIFSCLPNGKPKALESQEIQWIKPTELDLYQFPPPDKKFLEFFKYNPDMV